MRMPDSLAEKILKESGAVSSERLLELKVEVKSTHVPLAELILHYGLMSEEELALAFASELNVPYLKLSSAGLRPVHLRMLPEHISRRYRVVVFDVKPDNTRLVASDAQIPPSAQTILTKTLGPNYELHITTPGDLHAALDAYRQHGLISRESNRSTSQVTQDDPKVLSSINYILEQAILSHATSVHIEPKADLISVRFRIDGVLRQAHKLPAQVSTAINNRLKAMANLTGIAPQEGQFKVDSHHQVYRVEVLTLPVVDGEKITLNLFNESLKAPTLRELGLWGNNLENTHNGLIASHGLVLVAGPRGAGKATSLYGLLESLRVNNLNVLTIEDKLSFRLPSVSQLELGPRLQNYETALNAALKQDPEILLIDKVLSPIVADALIHLSTSSLVLAGVSSGGLLDSVAQLERFGIEPFRLAHAVRLALSVRVVRKLCDQCKQPVHPTNEVLKNLVKELGVSNIGGIKALHQLEKQAANEDLSNLKKTDLSSTDTSIKRLWRAKEDGCAHCGYTGYKGRVGLQEVLNMTDEIKAKLAASASASDIQKVALKSGFIPLRVDGLVKALRGLTSIEEVLSIL
jgi:type IV pilus assembly protein PilB